MKKLILFLLTFPLLTFSQLPDTDIWLADLTIVGDKVSILNPSNITSRKGYDNQPCFVNGWNELIYSSIRENDQADIYEYSLGNKLTRKLASTIESEYSPTVIPGSSAISVVRVEKDSTQRLWKLEEGKFSTLIPDIDSIGYHFWLDKDHVMLFLLGDPVRLVYADIKTQHVTEIDSSIGRGMNIKGELFFYVKKNGKGTIQTLHLKDKSKGFSIPTVEGSEDFIIAKDLILMAKGSKIFKWNLKSKKNLWEEVMDLSSFGLTNITRMAVDLENKKIAIVSLTQP